MTLAQWRLSTIEALGQNSAAVDYLDEKIATAPEHGSQEVPGDAEQIRAMLLQVHFDGEDRKRRVGDWTREQELARQGMAAKVKELVERELRSGRMLPWQIAQVLRAQALLQDTPRARDEGGCWPCAETM